MKNEKLQNLKNSEIFLTYKKVFAYIFNCFIKSSFAFILGVIISTFFWLKPNFKFYINDFFSIFSLKNFILKKFFFEFEGNFCLNPEKSVAFFKTLIFFICILLLTKFFIIFFFNYKNFLYLKKSIKFKKIEFFQKFEIVKFKNLNVLLTKIIFILFFITGFFYHSFLYQKLHKIQTDEISAVLNNIEKSENKSVYVSGFISKNPVFIDDKVIFELEARNIFYESDFYEKENLKNYSNENNSKIILLPKNFSDFKNLKFLVFSDKIKADALPEYKNFYTANAFIRKLDETETAFLHDIGFEQDVFYILDEVKSLKKNNLVYTSWKTFLLKNFINKYFNSLFYKYTNYSHKNATGFLKWIFLGEKKDLPMLFHMQHFIYNPFFILIESKIQILGLFLVAFILISIIGFSKNKKLFVFTSIFFIFIFNILQSINPLIISISVISTLFLLLFLIFDKKRSIFYAMVVGSLIIFFLLNNIFIFSNRWFLYFCVFSFCSVFLANKIDKFLCKNLIGWKYWGFFVAVLCLCFLNFEKFAINFFPLTKILPIFQKYFSSLISFNICSILILLIWLIMMNFLQKIYPMNNVNFKNIFPQIRYLFITWLIFFVFTIIPMSILYGNPVNISSFLIFFPVFVLLILSFIGMFFIFLTKLFLFSLFSFFLSVEKIYAFYDEFVYVIIYCNSIMIKYLILVMQKILFLSKNLLIIKHFYLFIFFYFSVIFLILFYKKLKIKLISFIIKKNLKNYFLTHKSKFNIKSIAILAAAIILFAYFSAKYFRNKEAVNIRFFQNNYGKYAFYKTLDKNNKNVLIWDVKKLYYIPINLHFSYNYSEAKFFESHGVKKIDFIIFKNFLANPLIFSILDDMLEKGYFSRKNYTPNHLYEETVFQNDKKFYSEFKKNIKYNSKNYKIFFDITNSDMQNIKSLNLIDLAKFFDLKEYEINNDFFIYDKFVTLNSFITKIQNFGFKIELLDENQKTKNLNIIENEIQNQKFLFNAIYKDSLLFVKLKYNLDDMEVILGDYPFNNQLNNTSFSKQNNKNLKLNKKLFLLKDKLFTNDFYIAINSLKFEPNINNIFLISRMSLKIFGTKIEIKLE